ncbi:MAG: ESPR-type extended signal peptide-containing protein, partial [Acinetobacter sp.]
MNHIFKKIWNSALGRMVVTSELAKNTVGGSGTVKKTADLNQNTLQHQTTIHLNVKPLLLAIVATMGSSVSWAGYICQNRAGDPVNFGSTSTGVFAFTCGAFSSASGDRSSALGYISTAAGDNSSATGVFALAQQKGATAVGGASDFNYYSPIDDGTKLLTINGIPVTATTLSTLSITKINDVVVTPQNVGDFVNTLLHGGSVAFGKNSSVVGSQSIAIGDFSSTLGHSNVALGEGSNATGYSNQALGLGSVAIGYVNQAAHTQSIAVGGYNNVTGNRAQAFGVENAAQNDESTAIGYQNTSTGEASTTLGHGNRTMGNNSNAMGSNNFAHGIGSTAFGSASGSDYSHFETDESKLISVAGIPVTASSKTYDSITEINGTPVAPDEVLEFISKIQAGGNVAFANHSTTMGSQNLAMGQYSSAFGFNNRSKGLSSNALGRDNIASGEYGNAIGSWNTASGDYSS